ncbi:uncharacterized protein LOC141961154 [Athene noctua]|uniref:uncharacterized protein LOC141961154 n=1 Tax=Athene noctua TaxID=126797 RepID=UPI003EB883CF
MEVNLENILSRDWSSRCREDRESSSIRRRRSRSFEGDKGGLMSPPSQILKRKRSSLPFSCAMGNAEVWTATVQVLYGSKYWLYGIWLYMVIYGYMVYGHLC